ncbi:protein of unknown function [Methylorubrum extorquens]|uniref:Uncharacterized protein n=1 Tax=Methylorubrum extorquens TaxID=408 RepID=A0A2N9ALX9_METEX|nr:protein of unknown function [Methylorubrum extorquens]
MSRQLVAIENIIYLSVALSGADRFRASAGYGVSLPSEPSLIVPAIPRRRTAVRLRAGLRSRRRRMIATCEARISP